MCTGPVFRNAVFSAAEFVSSRMLHRLSYPFLPPVNDYTICDVA